MATRDAGGQTINALAAVVRNLVGGSADLDPSTRTALKGCGDFESPHVAVAGTAWPTQGAAGGVWGYAGRNIHFGLREHAMAAVLTGMAVHDGLLPFGATFLSFSDYMRPSIRLAALSRARVIYIWTHDSIALGEDGPTHQPVEQLASLRAMPNMIVLRPSDATETVEAWRVALTHTEGPVGLVLTRQKVPVIDRSISPGLRSGAGRVRPGGRRRIGARGDPDRDGIRSLYRAGSPRATEKEGSIAGLCRCPAGSCSTSSHSLTATRSSRRAFAPA